MPDTLIYPVVQELLSCLCAALDTEYGDSPFKPQHCCVRAGESVSADASIYEDLCCEGLAWVRMNTMYVTNDEFPNPDTVAAVSGCGVQAWGLELEMGVLRCAPTGSISEIPTCEEWTTLTSNVARDAKAMRAAMCCLINRLDPYSVAIGQWSPLPTTGGCAGGSWNLTVQIVNDCEGC